MELKEVECTHCGNVQEDDVDNDSHVCDVCGEIFYSDEN